MAIDRNLNAVAFDGSGDTFRDEGQTFDRASHELHLLAGWDPIVPVTFQHGVQFGPQHAEFRFDRQLVQDLVEGFLLLLVEGLQIQRRFPKYGRSFLLVNNASYTFVPDSTTVVNAEHVSPGSPCHATGAEVGETFTSGLASWKEGGVSRDLDGLAKGAHPLVVKRIGLAVFVPFVFGGGYRFWHRSLVTRMKYEWYQDVDSNDCLQLVDAGTCLL